MREAESSGRASGEFHEDEGFPTRLCGSGESSHAAALLVAARRESAPLALRERLARELHVPAWPAPPAEESRADSGLAAPSVAPAAAPRRSGWWWGGATVLLGAYGLWALASAWGETPPSTAAVPTAAAPAAVVPAAVAPAAANPAPPPTEVQRSLEPQALARVPSDAPPSVAQRDLEAFHDSRVAPPPRSNRPALVPRGSVRRQVPAPSASVAGRDSRASALSASARAQSTHSAASGPALGEPAASASDRLRAELRLLDQARQALEGGDHAGAARLLETYERQFSAGELLREAALLRRDVDLAAPMRAPVPTAAPAQASPAAGGSPRGGAAIIKNSGI